MRYRYLGTDDAESTCSCCGKQNLKRVVWLVELDEDGNELGEPRHYGTTCAAHLLRGTCGKKPTVGEAKKIIDTAADAEKARLRSEFDRNYERGRDAVRHARMPEPERVVNDYGVPLIRVGDASASYGSRWHTPEQNDAAFRSGEGREAIRRAQHDWFHNRVIDWMEAQGMRTDTGPHGKSARRQWNPAGDDDDLAALERWWEIEAARKAEFADEIRLAFERDGIVAQPAWSDDSDWQVVLTRSARPGAEFQVTDFRGDEPLGHREFRSLDAAIADLWHHAPASIKRLPPMPNPSRRTRTLARRVAAL